MSRYTRLELEDMLRSQVDALEESANYENEEASGQA